MPLPRCRIRTMMAAVAVVGTTVGGTVLRQRSRYWSQFATAYAYREAAALEAIEHPRGCIWVHIDKRRARFTYWHQMRLHYERAARYPWLAIEPDPPEPN